MDRSTVVGIVLGLAFVLGVIILGPFSTSFWNVPSFVIVAGGVLATTLIKFPAPVVFGTARVVRQAFVHRAVPAIELVRTLVQLAEIVRRESLLAMERVPTPDKFLKRGVDLCLDGASPDLIESTLRTEVAIVIERHERGQRVFRAMGNASPAFGMIGTLIGLVQMLSGMEDPSKIGGSMAIALLTTFYGAFLAYVVFLPLADKLSERSRQEMLNREIVIQGLLSILAGHHPRMVERRLLGMLEPGVELGLRRPAERMRPAA